MSKIKLLPEILSNKIAAGEVVERPASVVKELVENSLDAGSSRINIEIEKGGRTLIRVSDNGFGMNRDDALLSTERYATSKIYADEDLFSIRTLGFRGEALPSIAAVSKMILITRENASDTATKLVIEGGKIKNVSQCGAPLGTMITIQHLFYNTPARRKFLKTITTEMGHIVEIVSSLALGKSNVHFELKHNHRIIKNWLKTAHAIDRTADVLGRDVLNYLCPIDVKDDGLAISGWISTSGHVKSTNRGIYVFVNGRFVRDRIVQHALIEGYGQRLMKGKYPVSVISIHLPFDQVDVNVHPTKSEVRFTHHRKIHDTIKNAVSESLKQTEQSKWLSGSLNESEANNPVQNIAEPLSDYNSVKQKTDGLIHDLGSNNNSGIQTSVSAKYHHSTPLKPKENETVLPDSFTIRTQTHPVVPPKPEKNPLFNQKTGSMGDIIIIGQLHHTYIICESSEGLVLIDQHAAHERIVYEQFKQRSNGLTQLSQRLIIPETVDLSYREAEILDKMIPDFIKLGLEIEAFGGSTYVVKAVPALLAEKDIKPILTDILDRMVSIGFSAGIEKNIDECLILMACHSAIRAGQSLTVEEMKGLLRQLEMCDYPSHCPHGRPTWIRWTSTFIDKEFKRVL